MKKLNLIITFIVIVLTLSASVFGAADTWKPAAPLNLDELQRGSDVIARFFICSDTHIDVTYTEDKLQYAYDVAGQLDTDALIIAGDLTENGSQEQYETLMHILRANSKELPVVSGGYQPTGVGDKAAVSTTIMVRGNHDGNKTFNTVTGMNADELYWINGVPVIGVSMQSGNYVGAYDSKYDFIKSSLEEITASGWDGHIFLITHLAPMNTSIESFGALFGQAFSPKLLELLAEYPQIINVTGHTHSSIYSSQFIDQSAGFTTMNDGILGKDYDNDDREFTSSAILFDVRNDGTTRFYRLNMAKGEVIFGEDEWVLDSADTAEDFIYFADPENAKNPNSYCKKSVGTAFPSDSETTIKDLGNFDSIEVTFPAITPVSPYNHDNIDRYYVFATPADGKGTVCSNFVKNDQYLPEANRAKSFTVKVTGLDYDTDYRVEVMTQTCSGVFGEPFVVSENFNIGTREFTYPVRTLYDIDYSYGELTDAMGHASIPSPISKAEYDETIGQQAAVFQRFVPHRYAFSETDLEKISMEFTIEAYFNLVDVETRQEVLGMADCASTSIGVREGNLYFLMETPECFENTFFRVPMTANEWVHIVVTYDSRNLSFYMNGELVDTVRQPGGLMRGENELFNSTVYVGGKNSANFESFHLEPGSKVNRVRIYQGTMTSEDVRETYEDTIKANVEHPFTDVAENSWYTSAARYVFEHGLMNGSSNTTFSPNVKTSRAMIVQMLYNMEGSPEVEYKNIFTDVKEKAWYADAVIWAYENGVTTGSSATTFSPDTLVTREQVAVFLYRYMRDFKGQKMDEGADLSIYPDEGKVSRYTDFKEAVAWANAVGILSGKSNGGNVTLAPLDNAQRSESATMFARFHRKFMN